jgi:hypothetical protein
MGADRSSKKSTLPPCGRGICLFERKSPHRPGRA